jgi:hypothetical protein
MIKWQNKSKWRILINKILLLCTVHERLVQLQLEKGADALIVCLHPTLLGRLWIEHERQAAAADDSHANGKQICLCRKLTMDLCPSRPPLFLGHPCGCCWPSFRACTYSSKACCLVPLFSGCITPLWLMLNTCLLPFPCLYISTAVRIFLGRASLECQIVNHSMGCLGIKIHTS